MQTTHFIRIALSLATVALLSVSASGQSCKNSFGAELQGDCMLLSSCTGAALASSTCNKAVGEVCCVTDTIKKASDPMFTLDMFLSQAGNTTRNTAMYSHFVTALQAITGANTINRHFTVAAFFAQLADESKMFEQLEADKADSDQNADLGNNSPNDGSFYRGRGAIHIRGKTNYALANAHLNKNNIKVDLMKNPERAAFPSVAFTLASWFWNENAFVINSKSKAVKGSLSQLADGTFLQFSLLTHALTSRYERLRARAILNENVLRQIASLSSMKRGEGVQCEIGAEVGYAVPVCTREFKRSYCGCEGSYSAAVCPYGFSGGACRNPGIIACCVEKCKSSMDLVVLMDGSGSIQSQYFVKEQEFVKNIVSKLKIGEQETRMAIVRYSDNADLIVNFNQSQTNETLQKEIDNIKYTGGGTRTDLALDMANEILQEKNGMRPLERGVPRVVIVITDGQSTQIELTIAAARRFKQRGDVSVISIGVGPSINQKELMDIATTITDVYNADDFNKIAAILNSIMRSTCQQPAQTEPETPIKSVVAKDAYKYFRFPLLQSTEKPSARAAPAEPTTNGSTYLQKFTIKMDVLKGDALLFYSFTDQNPKDEAEFINQNTLNGGSDDGNFIEKDTTLLRKRRNVRATAADTSANFCPGGLCQIDRPTSEPNDVVYFSVKGKVDNSEFQVYVYNRTVFSPSACTTIISNQFVVIGVALLAFVSLSFSN